MDEQDKKTKKRSSLPILLAVLVIIAYGALAYWQSFWPFSLLQQPSIVAFGSQFTIINRSIFPELKQLDQCGDWPISRVELSAGRGNPFDRKLTQTSVVTTTSVPQCWPAGQ